MRRRWLWLAGLGLAAGPLAGTSWSQAIQPPGGTSNRSARLGAPVAVTPSESISGVQPVAAVATTPAVVPYHQGAVPTNLPLAHAMSGSLPTAGWSPGVIVPPSPQSVGSDSPFTMPGTPVAAVIPSVQPPTPPALSVAVAPLAGAAPATGGLAPPNGMSPTAAVYPSTWPAAANSFPTTMPVLVQTLPMPTPMGTASAIPQASPSGPNVTEIRQPVGSSPSGPNLSPSTPPAATYVPALPPSGGLFVSGPEAPLYAPPGLEAVQRLTAPSKYYASAEFLLWWTKSAHLPPLLTTSSPQFQGIPGLGDTRVLFGGNFGNTLHAGGRFTIGRWFGDDQIRGVEGRLFFLGRTDSTFAVTSSDYPVLARPFFNVNLPVGPLSEVIAAPGRGLGAAVIDMQNDVWGAEANYRRLLWRSCCARLDALVGYRYFGMKERLGITESFISTGGNPILVNGIPVVSGTISDVFRAENHFHGGQIGLAWENRWGRWTFDARATIAFGNVTQQGEIDGGQALLLANGQTVRYAGGLLALPNANIGRYTHNQFAVLPEVGVNLGYQLTPHMRLFVGYNFLYLGNALRPERMIDTNIDIARIPNFVLPGGGTTPVPGLPRPAPLFRTNDFFVQGINFGLEFRW